MCSLSQEQLYSGKYLCEPTITDGDRQGPAAHTALRTPRERREYEYEGKQDRDDPNHLEGGRVRSYR